MWLKINAAKQSVKDGLGEIAKVLPSKEVTLGAARLASIGLPAITCSPLATAIGAVSIISYQEIHMAVRLFFILTFVATALATPFIGIPAGQVLFALISAYAHYKKHPAMFKAAAGAGSLIGIYGLASRLLGAAPQDGLAELIKNGRQMMEREKQEALHNLLDRALPGFNQTPPESPVTLAGFDSLSQFGNNIVEKKQMDFSGFDSFGQFGNNIVEKKQMDFSGFDNLGEVADKIGEEKKAGRFKMFKDIAFGVGITLGAFGFICAVAKDEIDEASEQGIEADVLADSRNHDMSFKELTLQ